MPFTRGIGEPTRLGVFDVLMEGVQCNCEIAERPGLSLSLVSHHVHALLKVGLVQSERDPDDAWWIYYSIDQEALARPDAAMTHLLDVNRIQPRSPYVDPRDVIAAEGWETRRYINIQRALLNVLLEFC